MISSDTHAPPPRSSRGNGAQVIQAGGNSIQQQNSRSQLSKPAPEVEQRSRSRRGNEADAWFETKSFRLTLSAAPSLIMRRFGIRGLDALQLNALQGRCLPLHLLFQGFERLALFDDHAVQLLHLMLQMRHGRFDTFQSLKIFFAHAISPGRESARVAWEHVQRWRWR